MKFSITMRSPAAEPLRSLSRRVRMKRWFPDTTS